MSYVLWILEQADGNQVYKKIKIISDSEKYDGKKVKWDNGIENHRVRSGLGQRNPPWESNTDEETSSMRTSQGRKFQVERICITNCLRLV